MNAVTAAAVDGLFARNERVVCRWNEAQQSFAMVLVGALFVGSISTVWHGEITPPSRRTARELAPIDGPGAHLARGDLMGWFNMGSTVIVLFPKGRVQWLPGLAAGTADSRRAAAGPAAVSGMSSSGEEWRPSASLERLRLRATLLARTRAFFAARQVLEVDTPGLVNAAVTDVHIHVSRWMSAGRQRCSCTPRPSTP